MFMDLEIMNMDARTVRGVDTIQGAPPNLMKGLSTLYKEIIETVRKEAATVAAVFPSPDAVMAILVQVSVNTEHSLVFILSQAKD
jgi:hypothetical protein